jgi:hypothetical protein
VAASSSFAQFDYEISSSMEFYRNTKLASGDFKQVLESEDIKGSPYLNDEFILGTVFTTSKYQFVDIPLRYNIYNGDLEFRTNENEILAMSTPEIIERVEFGEYKMVYIPYELNKKIKRGFFKVIKTGEVSLYASPQIIYQQPEEPGVYKDAKPAKFVSQPDEFYLRNKNEAAVEVSNKKEVLAFFPSHQKELEAFIKKNKIKTNKEDDLTKLVEYYNSL